MTGFDETVPPGDDPDHDENAVPDTDPAHDSAVPALEDNPDPDEPGGGQFVE